MHGKSWCHGKGQKGGGGQNWWSMKWDFETGAGRVDLTKEGGMSQEARQGRVQRGGGLHAGVETNQHTATGLQCIVLQAHSPRSHLEFGVQGSQENKEELAYIHAGPGPLSCNHPSAIFFF